MAKPATKPCLIIHGGAGNITRENLPPKAYARYEISLRRIHRSTSLLLDKGATALDAATHAVILFEDCPDFNCAKGAVRRQSNPFPQKEWSTEMRIFNKVKNPIKLAREMLVHGEADGSGDGNGGNGDPSGGSGGAQGHCCLGGETAHKLAEQWGLEMVEESYYWTKKRWDQHRKGLHSEGSEKISRSAFPENEIGWDGIEYLPQGTVGCVALDQYGALCVATSTGGLTNKLPCRIGDTPTIGAGFWAEEWDESPLFQHERRQQIPAGLTNFTNCLQNVLGECVPSLSGYRLMSQLQPYPSEKSEKPEYIRAVAMSGTGNGDSFLRTAAARTAGAIARFSQHRTLDSAVNQIAGPQGELQRSAGDRWGKTGEGEGGIIGIELADGKGEVVFDFNCGGMFRCWIDGEGKERVMVFRDEY
ncbi:hypothetical protein P7C71_g3945, partial [Lecanoromycetidae sp. Uapishka_2]